MDTQKYDVIVVGSGQGGGPLSSAFARSGKKTALIEREFAGGTCVNWGCTPTKTMVASARATYLARRGKDYGVETGDISMNMKTVRQRKRDIVDSFRSGSQSGIDSTDGLTYIHGDARFEGEKSLTVDLVDGGTVQVQAETIVLNVGERSRPLDIDVPEGVDLLDNRTVMELDEVPDHLVVIGGGPLGLEFAQMFRRFGAKVTVLNRGDRVLSREDDDIAEGVVEILTEDGIAVINNAEVSAISKHGNEIVLEYGEMQISASHVLVAAGRSPNTDDLGVDNAEIELDKRGYILTNDRLETNIAGTYAIGDVRPGPKFTHISYDDFRILKANLIDGGDRSIKDRLVPATTYIDPQLGRIGPTESEIRERGIPYLVASMPMSRVARALETDEPRGLMKVLVHAETDQILSGAILGIEGGEIASMLQIAMMGHLPYTALRDGVFAHPTLAESLNNLFASLSEPK